jgi:topoisomerase-4 subunit A
MAPRPACPDSKPPLTRTMPKAAPPPPPPPPAAIDVNLREALEERYLAYALSTIMGRALPDARDGLKPVHRRILYAMHILKLDPTSAFKKCAKIVGDVMGSFHPHGDQAIYEALVRLAQDFSSRYPLVEGQGNFGNIDGDGAAAYRYTEARMTDVARLLLEGIDEDSIDFRDNYSGDTKEPIVLPAALPNLLANGSQGIAVGMATSIPPHNAAELCDAALHLISHPKAPSEALLQFAPGPDFPTGGIIIDAREQIAETYRTGRGSFRVRARWAREEAGRGTWVAVVTEIPYGVQKSRLIEQLANLLNEKKVPLLADVRDESTEDVRIVLEPRSRTVEPATLMESLFKLSELEARVPMNMNVLVDGVVPRVVGLNEALRQWLDHRRDVLLRRSRHRLAAIERRLEMLAGMVVVFLNLDEVIRIIREEEDPKAKLIARFKLSEAQVNYILDTRLRALRRLEEVELKREHSELQKEKGDIDKLLRDEKRQWQTVAYQIKDTKKKYGPDTKIGRRRTTFEAAPDVVIADLNEALLEREPVTIVVSQKGWIRALKGHIEDLATLAFKGDDGLKISFPAETTSKILVVATNGKAFTLEAAKLPGGRGHGEPIRLMADIEDGADIAAVLPYRAGAKALIAGSDGRGFIVGHDDMLSSTRKGRAVLILDTPAEAAVLTPAEGDHIAIIGQNRKLLIFSLAQAPEMARGKGVRLQRYKDGGVSDARVFTLKEGLTWRDSSQRLWTVEAKELKDWIGNRAEAGRLPPKGFPKNNKFG